MLKDQKYKLLVAGCLAALYMLGAPGCRNTSNETSNQANNNATPGRAQATPPMPALPPGFPQPVVSGNIPLAVPNIPSSVTTPEQARPFFDYFSWESFIALNWPAAQGQRGVPNQPDNPQVFYQAAQGGAVVWNTYKDSFELFGQKDQRPTPWDSTSVPIAPCQNTPPGMLTLTLITKGDTTLDDINQAFSYPLIDQHKNYAFYDVRYNKAQYEFVRGLDADKATWLYLLPSLAAKEPVSMPASSPPSTQGAMMLKSAWREMTTEEMADKDVTARYYIVQAQVYDFEKKSCVQKNMGLVGLHIAQKLKDFPEWIWSTFEQVDNVARGHDAKPNTPISFNNGTTSPATVGGYANRPPAPAPSVQPVDQRVPVQVTRLNPIPDTPNGSSTRDINSIYQQLMKGTVWQYYELVFTQWPSDPKTFKTMDDGGTYPKYAGGAFPATGVTNTTMETYFQSQNDAVGAGGNSCMSCHYRADKTDFSWGLMRRAHQ
jgi:hypothetical protein